MNNWPIVKLGEVLSLDLDRIEIDSTVTYPMVGVYSFGRGLFDREPVHGGNTSYRNFYRLRADHIVMSQLFGWEGALALSSAEFSGKFVSPQFPTFIANEEKLDRRYLGWYIRRPPLWEELGTRTRGMGDRRRTLNPDALLSCEIPLPQLSEQRRIVAKIEQLAAKIEEARGLRNQIIDEGEQLCRSIILSHLYEKSVPTPMEELVKWRKPDVEVLPTETYHFAGVYCFGRGVFAGERKTGLDFSYKQLTKIRSGDFIYPKLMAWEGALAVVPVECDGLYVSPEFPVFEINTDRVLPEALDVYFRTPAIWPQLSGSSTGTNVRRRRLNPSDFLKYEFPLPPMRLQQLLRIVKAQVDRLKVLQAQTAVELEALLPSILDKTFKGEL